MQTSSPQCRWTAYTKMGKNKCGLSMVEFLAFTVSLPATKISHCTLCGGKYIPRQDVASHAEARREQPRWCWPCRPLRERNQPIQEHSKSCLWGMCQIRFLCNFQTLNKWTSRAKCFLRLGSGFCAYTRACSQTTHTLAGSGWANPTCISLCAIMRCVLCCSDVKGDSRGQNPHPLGGWRQSGCGDYNFSSVLLFSGSLKWGSSHILLFCPEPLLLSSICLNLSCEMSGLTRNRSQPLLNSESSCYLPHSIQHL